VSQCKMNSLNIIAKEPINKGWSSDKKYCLTTDQGDKYLLRISPKEKTTNRKELFSLQEKVADLGVPMCKPLKFGECDEGFYTIQTWIYGQDAEEIIPYISDSDQYAYGLEAGKIPKLIHSIPAPASQPDWEVRFSAKMDQKIKMYKECPIKLDGAENFITYIESNRNLLVDRTQTFQHGDYHIGNMMIENGKLIIIDFDRYDFGDPWEEFNRIVWCAQASPRFASGKVNGYFNNDVPQKFWDLLALYISSNMLSSLPWAYPFGEKEVETMINQAKDVLNWYNNMENTVPSWYYK
jgi:aminoglycoside phosphotransferase (APT) family kinase protein